MKLTKIILLFILSLNMLYSQNTSKTKYGVYGGYNLNSHSADFQKLEGIPNCCPEFRDGSGGGINAGLLFEYRLNPSFLIGARLGILSLDGLLKNEELTTIITNSGPTTGIFEHKLEGKFMNLGLEPSLIYNPFGGLLLNVGIRAGMNLTKDYDQVETIIKPEGEGTFLDENGNDTGLRTRNKYNGEIPNAVPFQIFATGGLSYELPLNKSNSFRVAPEVQYYLPITELVENTQWKVNTLRLGLALKYVPVSKPPKQKLFERQYEIDTIRIPSDIIAQVTFKKGEEQTRTDKFEDDEKIINYEKRSRTDTIFTPRTYKLNGNISIVGVDKFGKEIPTPLFKIEEFISNRLDPLLNYIFFDNNSSVLPSRYNQITPEEAKEFTLEKLFYDSTLKIYHNILNIVGKRMQENPTATITLTGCNSDLDLEKGNKELSHKRAEEVKSYLTRIWKISDNRIKIQVRNLPQKASTPINEPDKIAENRRVEITSDNEKITEPIFIEKIDRIANPPIARMKLEAEAEAGLKYWEVIAYQNSNKTDKFEYKKDGEIISQIDWELSQYQKITPKNPEPVIAELHLYDKKNNHHKSTAQTKPIEVITIQEKRKNRVGDYEVEKFSLILFDFDKATIENQNQRIIDFIKTRVKPESEIEIIGYTDRTGNPEYNKRLSERRAKTTLTALNRKDATAKGLGQEKLLYNNDLPEGRFYCRTVEIIVRTKVE